MLSIIVATDKYGGIAKDGKIPWRCSADLKFFKEMTEDSPMIMGRKTWDTLPDVVKARRCIVLSHTLLVPAYRNTKALRETIRMALDATESMYVIGGESIYRQFLPYCGVIYRTVIPHNFQCDQSFTVYPVHWGLQSVQELEGPVYNKRGMEIHCETPYVERLSRKPL